MGVVGQGHVAWQGSAAPEESDIEAVLQREDDVEGGEREGDRGGADSGEDEIAAADPGRIEADPGWAQDAPHEHRDGYPEAESDDREAAGDRDQVDPGEDVGDERVGRAEQGEEQGGAEKRQGDERQNAGESRPPPPSPGDPKAHPVERRRDRREEGME
jgi:hypothetical protein